MFSLQPSQQLCKSTPIQEKLPKTKGPSHFTFAKIERAFRANGWNFLGNGLWKYETNLIALDPVEYFPVKYGLVLIHRAKLNGIYAEAYRKRMRLHPRKSFQPENIKPLVQDTRSCFTKE